MMFQENIQERLRLLDQPAAWALFLAILPLVFSFAYLVYRWENLTSGTRKVLVLLRGGILFLILLLLFRPVIERVQVMVQRGKLLFLLDDSASMQRKDSYPDSATRAAIHEAANLAPKELPGDFSRAELMSKALNHGLLEDLRSRYDVELFRFSDQVSPASKPEETTGRGDRTRIGEALSQLVEQHRGQFVKGVVLVSDGQSNEGRDPRDVARACSGIVPIDTVGVGDATSPKNISVSIVEAPQFALEGDEITVTARILATGYAGRQVTLSLEKEDAHEVLGEQNVPLEEGEGNKIALSFTPPTSGEYRLVIKAHPLPEETLTDDNSASFTLQVRPEKIRVLYVEGRPRYEYRYLKNTLLRADRNLVVQCYLLSANYEFPQESTKGIPALTTVPTRSEDLLKNYDVILLGDVDPYGIAPSHEQCNQFMAAVKEFVEKGGGFLMIAGEYDSPRSYAGTPIAELLPVVLGEGEEDSIIPGIGSIEFHPILENANTPHEICRLNKDNKTNQKLWEDPEGLRGLYWYYPVRKPKPAAEVLLRHPENKNRYGNHVLAAVTYYPEGRTMYLGFDETWRWRFLYGETYFERFWRNVVRYLALNRLREGDRRFRLNSEKSHYEINERVVLEARILNEDFSPSRNPQQKVFLRYPDGRKEETNLDAVPGQTGFYRASVLLGNPGSYQAWISDGNDPQGKALCSVDFQVSIPSRELSKLNLNQATLEAVAKLSGGKYLRLGEIQELKTLFQESGEIRIPVLPPSTEDLWDNAYVLSFLVLLLAAEWMLRKKSLLI